MKAVILAGGFGRRMGGLAEPPKPLHRIGPQPVIEHVMSIYRRWSVSEFIVCVGHRSAELLGWFEQESGRTVRLSEIEVEFHFEGREESPYRVIVVDTGEETSSGGRLKRIEHRLDTTFLLTYADGLADVDVTRAVQTHRQSGSEVTMTGVPLQIPYGVATASSGIVTKFEEKPTLPGLLTNIGFYVVEPAAVANWCEGDSTSWERDVLPLIANEGRLSVHEHSGFWAAMDYPHQHADLIGLWEEQGAVWLGASGDES